MLVVRMELALVL